jgi:nitrogen fixation/metabolism regulation signal transduction histidine kinase
MKNIKLSLKRLKLTHKISIVILLLSFIPLIVVWWLSLNTILIMSEYTALGVKEMSNEIYNDTRTSLEELASELIKQKAIDVAKQIQIFIKHHPDLNISELEANEELQKIAVQRVGKTGYTAVHDRNGINHFHVNPKMVGFDLHNLADKFPDFWKILEKSLTEESFGYYKWEDADGKIRSKYIYCTPIEETDFSICATTYMDEFLEPMKKIENEIKSSSREMITKTKMMISQTQNIFLIICFVSIALILIITIIIPQTIVRPITKLRDVASEISKGNLDITIDIESKDEIGELAESFNRMTKELKLFKKKVEKHSEELEKKVKKRTRELNKKIEELERFHKIAVRRELKMIELKRRIRELEEQLKKRGKT